MKFVKVLLALAGVSQAKVGGRVGTDKPCRVKRNIDKMGPYVENVREPLTPVKDLPD